MNSQLKRDKRSGSISAAGPLLLILASLLLPSASLADTIRQPQYLTDQEQAKAAARQAKEKVVSRIHLTSAPVGGGLPSPPSGVSFINGTLSNTAGGTKHTSLGFTTRQDKRTVVDWYERSLRDSGWKVKESPDSDKGPRMISAQKGNHESILIFVSESKKNSGQCGIGITLTEKQ